MELRSRQMPAAGLLHETLERALSRHFGSNRTIRQLRRRSSAYSSSYALENLELTLNGGKRLRLVFKDLSPSSVLKTAQRIRPGFLYRPEREIEIYQRVLDPCKLGTPICYGATRVPEMNRYWLFLERVDGPLLWQRGRLKSWEQAAGWLAKLHTEYRTSGIHWKQSWVNHLVHYDEKLLGTWMTRAEAFIRRDQGYDSPEGRRRFSRLADHYDRVIDRLLELPKSLIHGEFFPSNVILRPAATDRTICPVDWEMAAVGPGLIDLAALTAGKWRSEQKRAMIAAYRRGLELADDSPPSVSELLEAVDYCQLHLSVQLLGWAADWSPPQRHTQNWLGEAVRLSGALGL